MAEPSPAEQESLRRRSKSGLLAGRGWALAVIVLFSLSLRLVCLQQISGTPLFGFFARDSLQYEESAAAILRGSPVSPETVYFNAVYPFFLAAVHLLLGPGLNGVFLVQILLSAATTVFLYLITLKLTGSKAAGLLAALLHAGHDLSVFYAVVLLDTTLSAFLLAGLVLALVHAADDRHPGLWLLAGGVLGVCLVLRTNVALFLPLLVGWIATRGQLPESRRRWAIAGVCAGVAAVLLPFSLRRHAVDRGFSPFPASGGLNFYIGNHPGATGGFVSLEHLNIPVSPVDLVRQSIAAAERETGERLSPSQASRYWFFKGLRFVGENPARAAALSFKKALLFWNWNEAEPNINFYFSREFLPVLGLPLFSFAVIGPLALTGIALALWRRQEALSLVVLFVAGYMLSLTLFFVSSRYRFPSVPLMTVLAAYALESWRRSPRGARSAEVVATAALAAVFFLVVGWNIPGVPATDNFSVARFNLGNLHLEGGRLDEAASEYRKIPGQDPNYPRARYNLALVYERKGLLDEAMAEYRRVLAADPGFAKAHSNLGLLSFKRGWKAEALLHYQQALAADPGLEDALVNLGLYYRDRGMMREAYDSYRRALAVNPGNGAVHHDVAVLCYLRRDFTEAADHYRKAVGLGYRGNPAFREALQAHVPGLTVEEGGAGNEVRHGSSPGSGERAVPQSVGAGQGPTSSPRVQRPSSLSAPP